jgi:PatG Domain
MADAAQLVPEQSEPTEGTTRPAAMIPAPAPLVDRAAFVYALGRVQPQFPSLAIEKEFVQATGRADLAGLTDREAVSYLLADPANRYLARQMCWVLTIEGIETYLLHPRDPQDLTLLIEAVRPTPRATDVDVVIGVRGPLATAEMCNGLIVPVVVVDQLYSFDTETLLGAIPRPDSIEADRFAAASEDIFHRVQQIADNAGATDEHRALNYLAVRSSAIYERATIAFGDNLALDSVDAVPSNLSDTRRILDVVFSYRNRATGVVEKYATTVDVTEEFPFLVRPLGPYYHSR